MIIETLRKSASSENRLAARQWVEAFNARDDEGEANARTAGYIGYAPESMHLPALDSEVERECLLAFELRGGAVLIEEASPQRGREPADLAYLARQTQAVRAATAHFS